MQSLRNASLLARLVLVWFTLAVGIATASPLVSPKSISLICTGSGAIQLLIQGDDGGTSEATSHTLDCPLCAAVAPPAAGWKHQTDARPAEALPPHTPAARTPQRSTASLPARGPPASDIG